VAISLLKMKTPNGGFGSETAKINGHIKYVGKKVS
jgi:hypothetical protein